MSAVHDNARAFIADVTSLLRELTLTQNRLLALAQSNGLNFLSAGSTSGGGTLTATTPIKLLDANPHRRGCSVQNLSSTGSVTLGLGQTQPQTGTGLVLAAGASWDGRISGSVWRGSVTLVGAVGAVYSFLEVAGPTQNQQAIN